MHRFAAGSATALVCLTTLATGALRAAEPAPRPPWTRSFLQHAVTLATLDDVAAELKLSDEQRKTAADLETKLREGRQEIFQNAAGDFEKIREEMNKFSSELAEELSKSLDDAQRKRIREVYLQVNGLLSLQDESVVKSLELNDEQHAKLEEAIRGARERMFASFQDFQGMSEEQRNAKTEELAKQRDESYAAVLDEKQAKKFEELKGKAAKVDLSKLPSPFGG
jgi:hypothetical protein